MQNSTFLICPWCKQENDRVESIWQNINAEIKLNCKACKRKSIHTTFGIAKVYGSRTQHLYCKILSWITFLYFLVPVALFFGETSSQLHKATFILATFLISTWISITGLVTGVTPGRISTYRDINKKQFNMLVTIFSFIAVITGLISAVLIYQVAVNRTYV